MVEPKYPGVVESYVNIGDCYDKKALGDVRAEILSCMGGYPACYQRAYRCLGAAEEIAEDVRSIVISPPVEAKIAKRSKGILSREIKKTGEGAGQVKQRFLSAVTHRGLLAEFDTVDKLPSDF